MDEDKIRAIIREELIRLFTEDTALIREMAVSRNDYKQHFWNLINQIVINWCLVKYCRLYDRNNLNYYHWMGELKAHLINVSRIKLTNKNSPSVKYKALKEIWDGVEYNNPQTIRFEIIDKFLRENITDDKIINELSELCSEDGNKILEIISIGNIDNLTLYLETF